MIFQAQIFTLICLIRSRHIGNRFLELFYRGVKAGRDAVNSRGYSGGLRLEYVVHEYVSDRVLPYDDTVVKTSLYVIVALVHRVVDEVAVRLLIRCADAGYGKAPQSRNVSILYRSISNQL